MTIALRDYQEDAVKQIRAAYALRRRRVVFVLPTAGGKTILFTYMVKCAAEKGSRVLILAHRTELIEQIGDTLDKFGVEHGLITSGRSGNGLPIQVGMMGTVARRLDRLHPPSMIIVDEAHRSLGATYQRILGHWPSAYVLLVTATPARTDGRGLGAVADEMIVGPSVRKLIEDGYLSRYRLFAPPQLVDLDGIRKRGGDFDAEEIQARMDVPTITGDCIDHYHRLANGRQFVAFCAGVRHAEHVAQAFLNAGVMTASIDGSMPSSQRADIIARFRAGAITGLTSCDLISEGFDIPSVCAAILLRPTQSKIVYLQQVGRALRIAPGKEFAVILDHVGNAERHGLPDADRQWSLADGIVKCKSTAEKEISTRLCGNCFAYYLACLHECPHCGTRADRKSRALAEVDGELVEVTPEDEWRARLSKLPHEAAVVECETPEQLRAYAAMKAYRPGWAIRTLLERGYSVGDACSALGYDRRAVRFIGARR